MGELKHCPSCNDFFNYTGIREVCNKCALDEEKLYEEVYRFLRKRENRAATIERIVEVIGVKKSLLHKWVRKGRLQPATFPNLGYPCDNCGKLITQGKLCENCVVDLKSGLRQFDAAIEFRNKVNEHEATYRKDRR
ncbi:flagellar operon protein (TIGR03826 family) [Psychrobacillus insolitus]|uniref:Flagellar operon protein (TIGR03826 family) n=1 Tax=Psychrobacillus insolitus TaxID=1461 RepID=A0A2W7MX22_9BACI|nr:TIGR03826 family flagellar region protein [Psychrobacillus insolitus]PZX08271.1 flagellar operon protein (TIGR03826 family) [Psychrobacillus insolitus]